MLWPCRGLEKNGMVRAWHGRGMASVNQTRPHCVNQMEKTHSEPLAVRHGRGTAWARHAMCELAFTFAVVLITGSMYTTRVSTGRGGFSNTWRTTIILLLITTVSDPLNVPSAKCGWGNGQRSNTKFRCYKTNHARRNQPSCFLNYILQFCDCKWRSVIKKTFQIIQAKDDDRLQRLLLRDHTRMPTRDDTTSPTSGASFNGRTWEQTRNSAASSNESIVFQFAIQNLKIKTYRTIILPAVLCGCETWSLTLREERRLRVFENGVLRRVFGPTRGEVTENGENYIMRSLGIFTPYPILCRW